MHHTPLLISLAVASLTTSAIASDESLEEVIINAQKQTQNALDAAVSVATIDAETIRDRDISSLEELSSQVPGLDINGGSSQPNLFVRGVGSGLNIGFEQSVGIFVDDIYLGRAQFVRAPLTLDLGRAEFIYGPQGSTLGKNTVAGALNLQSVLPEQPRETSLTLLYEPLHEERSINAAISGSISESLSGRLALRRRWIDGWWHNTTLGSDGPEADNTAVRGTLRWQFDNTEIRFKVEHAAVDTQHSPFIVYQSEATTNFLGAEPFPVLSDGEQAADDLGTSDDSEFSLASLHFIRQFDNLKFTSITGFAGYDTRRVESVDFSPQPALHRWRDENYAQFSQEFRLQSSAEKPLQWSAGFYAQQQSLQSVIVSTETDFLLLGPLSTPAIIEPDSASTVSDFDQDSRSLSAYLQADYALTETLTFSAGLRYTRDDKEASKLQSSNGARARLVFEDFNLPEVLVFTDSNGILIDELRSHSFPDLNYEEDHLNWNLSLRWQQDGLMLYANANTAFKSGGFDEAYGGADGTVTLADPLTGVLTGETLSTGIGEEAVSYNGEEVLAFELGAKWRFNKGRAELYSAVFHARYDDLQTSALDVDQFVVVNAGKAISEGIEAGGRFLIGEHFRLQASLSLLDARWDSFENAPCTVAQTTEPASNPGCLDSNGVQISNSAAAVGQDLSGETLQFAPDFSANISLGYLRTLGQNLALFSRLSVAHRSSYYSALDLDPATRHDATSTVDLSVGLSDIAARWRLALIGKNLNNQKNSIFNGDVPTTASASYFGIPQRTRSVALQLHIDW